MPTAATNSSKDQHLHTNSPTIRHHLRSAITTYIICTTHIYTYTYTYTYVCICVCVCVCLSFIYLSIYLSICPWVSCPSAHPLPLLLHPSGCPRSEARHPRSMAQLFEIAPRLLLEILHLGRWILVLGSHLP